MDDHKSKKQFSSFRFITKFSFLRTLIELSSFDAEGDSMLYLFKDMYFDNITMEGRYSNCE